MAPPDISSNRSSLLSDVTSERNQRYASAERVVHELSGTIAREQLDNSRVRMGLASNAINDTRQAIGSFIRFLESRPELAASYQSTIEKLKERSTELGAQQKLLGESAKRSDQLAASGKTTDAILAAEPAFAKASGNTIEGLLSGAKKAIEELQRGERLLGAKDPSMFEQYQRLFVSKNVTAWTSLMIEGGPEDFTTGSNVKRGKYPGVGLPIQEALAGPSPAAVGQAIAVAGLLLPTLRETLPSFITDSQLIALPRTRITDPAQIKEGNAGYQELVRGTITEVRPRGSFNFPSLPPVEDAVSPGSPAAGDKRPSVNGAGSASSGERESRPVASASGDHRSVESKRTKAKTPQASAPSADSPASTTAPNTATDAASAAVEKPTEREANTPRSQREETRDRLRELDRAQREVSSDLAAAVSTITVDKSLDEVRTILSEARSRAVERLETLHPNIESDVREWRRLRDSAARGLSPTNPNFTDWRSPERRQAEQDEQAQKALGSDGTVQIMDRVDRFVAELISKNEHVRTLSDERAIELAQKIISDIDPAKVTDIVRTPYSVNVIVSESAEMERRGILGVSPHGIVNVVLGNRSSGETQKETIAEETFHSLRSIYNLDILNEGELKAHRERMLRDISVHSDIHDQGVRTDIAESMALIHEELLARIARNLPAATRLITGLPVSDDYAGDSHRKYPSDRIDPNFDSASRRASELIARIQWSIDLKRELAPTEPNMDLGEEQNEEFLRLYEIGVAKEEDLLRGFEALFLRAARASDQIVEITKDLDEKAQVEIIAQLVTSEPRRWPREVQRILDTYPDARAFSQPLFDFVRNPEGRDLNEEELFNPEAFEDFFTKRIGVPSLEELHAIPAALPTLNDKQRAATDAAFSRLLDRENPPNSIYALFDSPIGTPDAKQLIEYRDALTKSLTALGRSKAEIDDATTRLYEVFNFEVESALRSRNGFPALLRSLEQAPEEVRDYLLVQAKKSQARWLNAPKPSGSGAQAEREHQKLLSRVEQLVDALEER